MRSIGCLMLLLAIGLTGPTGCRSNARIEDPLSVPTQSTIVGGDLARGAALQRILASEASAIQADFVALAEGSGWRERGYLDGPEHDAIEALLFRFVGNRGVFWEALDGLGGAELLQVPEIEQPRAHVLALHTGLSLADSSAFLVSTFIEDQVAIDKLNEAFYRSEIPRGSYDQLRLAVTSRVRNDALANAWSMHQEALSDPDSPIAAIAAADDDFARLLADLPALNERALRRIERVRDHGVPGVGKARASLEHSPLAEAGRSSGRAIGDFEYETRALVFTHVSRIQSPTAKLITFTSEQKRQIFAALRPGDLLLTYTAGYVSSVFIPGRFKHGITYVGDLSERRAAGLEFDRLPDSAIPEADRFAADLRLDRLPNGGRADLIEAVAEGVKFSNLDHILDTHVNRLLILRPDLTAQERARFLAGVFAYLGDPYDFRFDFADASRQVCTEVIYRALQGQAGFAFELKPRGGNPTLSADDIVEHHLAERPGRLDFVLLAEKDPDTDEQASRILIGEAGARRLRALMGEERAAR
jgi:hypothetical protein